MSESHNLYVPRAGRPRQPYCPDCKRELPPRYTLKKPGQGYCAEHQTARVKKNYLARRAAADPDYQHPKDRTNALVEDIRSALRNGMPLSPERIRELFLENALPSPSFEQIQETFFPETEVVTVDRDAAVDAFNEALEKYNAEQANPYD